MGLIKANLFAMTQQHRTIPLYTARNGVWRCSCGEETTGKFCPECGLTKMTGNSGWICTCGVVNKGRFCQECGARKPESLPLYRCDKCGWQPVDPAHPPKFCPECGDFFNENDKIDNDKI